MRSRSIVFKMYKLNKIIPTEMMRTIYQTLYKSIIQYGLIIWESCANKSLRPLEVQQNLMVRLCPNKKDLIGSSNNNYIDLNVLLVRSLYMQFSILHELKKLEFIEVINVREIRP